MDGVVELADRRVYDMRQVDAILALRSGTARRWIDGYDRAGRSYPPVVRERRTNDGTVTWGEFVETRLLAEFRQAGVPLLRLRPTVERLRDELQTAYPLASARTWLSTEGREVVRDIQDDVHLSRALHLVVVRNGQQLLWSTPAEAFRDSLEWSGPGADAHVSWLRPAAGITEVHVNPLRGYGEPVVRGVRTAVLASLVRAGESPDALAELYELNRSSVDAALRYELVRAAA